MFLFIYLLISVYIIAPSIASPHQSNLPVSLLFTTYHDVRLANITRHNGPPSSIETLAKDLQEAGALDFFYEKQLVCWVDQHLQRIQCMKLNGSPNTTQNVITSGLDKPEVN